jgi:bacteriorhodopsin
MFNKSDPTPISMPQVANYFRVAGWGSFWTQVVLGVIAIVTLVFANAFRGSPSANAANPAVGLNFGLFCAFLGLLILGGSIYFAFRYARLSRQLLAQDVARPKKSEVTRIVQWGLSASLVGMLLTLISANAVVGGLVPKASRAVGVGIAVSQGDFYVNTLDMLTVQAILLILLALFVGIVTPLFLLTQINRPLRSS